jgi:hypothetical protein
MGWASFAMYKEINIKDNGKTIYMQVLENFILLLANIKEGSMKEKSMVLENKLSKTETVMKVLIIKIVIMELENTNGRMDQSIMETFEKIK